MNAAAASREYAELHPQCRRPNPNIILQAINRGRHDGNVLPLGQRGPGQGVVGAPRVARNVENEEMVLACFAEDPERSIRTVARLLELSYSTVQRILKTNALHAYHYQRVHQVILDYWKIILFVYCHVTREQKNRFGPNKAFSITCITSVHSVFSVLGIFRDS